MTKDLRKEFNLMVARGEIKHSESCACCGATETLQFHHIMPLSLGGDNRQSNIMTMCAQCHSIIHNNKGLRDTSKSEKVKKDIVIIDNETKEEYKVKGYQKASETLLNIEADNKWQITRQSTNGGFNADNLKKRVSRLKTTKPKDIEETEEFLLIKNLFYKGNVAIKIYKK